MTEYKIVLDAISGVTSEIDLTADEIMQRDKDAKVYAKQKAEHDLVLQAKADAKAAIATRLGLSADELATLLS
jgi:hypothetical protein